MTNTITPDPQPTHYEVHANVPITDDDVRVLIIPDDAYYDLLEALKIAEAAVKARLTRFNGLAGRSGSVDLGEIELTEPEMRALVDHAQTNVTRILTLTKAIKAGNHGTRSYDPD